MSSIAVQAKFSFKDAQAVGLSELEWEHLLSELGRQPSYEELHMIGVMWSEHCSYKNTKDILKRFVSKGSRLLQGPGENAGLVDLDGDRALAFKIESHNHPSYVEAFQGAATGVGGILRDIFTVGAKPIALGNYLRFGPLLSTKQRHLLEGVVSGISHYGNCVGVPMLGGEVHTQPCYEGNILVNVFALGIVDRDKVFLSNSAKPGQTVMIWGAKTGRDGVHGASLLASSDFDSQASDSTEQKIRVQVGDPFKEKCLIDACLEAMQEHPSELAAIQDMGAAGLTCSTMEIADKSQIGMRINLDRVPVREEQMQAFELLLSESQERMLAVVKKGSEANFQEILHRWGCDAEVIGETTGDGQLKFLYQGTQVVNLPVKRVMDPPPLAADRISESPDLQVSEVKSESFPPDVREEWAVLNSLLSLPRIASKEAIYERYDSSVGASTLLGPGHEAGVLWVGNKEHPHLGVAFKGGCDEELAGIDSGYAARYSMLESIRGLACVGAQAVGMTDGVNLGSPKRPETLNALRASVEGFNEVIELFDSPCVSGNVSLHNENELQGKKVDILPTIFNVVVGVIQDIRKTRPSKFQAANNEVWLLEAQGDRHELPVGSCYAREYWPEDSSYMNSLPFMNLASEKRLCEALLEAHRQELFVSCRDVSDGGVACSLAEACFSENHFGFVGDWSKAQARRDKLLFGEGSGKVIVEIHPSRRAELMKLALAWKLEYRRLGSVTDDEEFSILPLLKGPAAELEASWKQSLR